ncbi:MAG TPA: hypothetical protein VJ828_18430 [Lacipirellulaceae bacterium]|nr:hypothetical protein [Lacipirellulaceae bacterium]
MVKFQFPDTDVERKAHGFLAGRFPFKTFADGYTLVPESALPKLTDAGIPFTDEGRGAEEIVIPAF